MPLDRFQYVSALCDLDLSALCDLDLLLIAVRGLVMDYRCGKFGDCSFSRFRFIIMRTNKQPDKITLRCEWMPHYSDFHGYK